MESLNALCVLFSMVYGPPLFSSPSLPRTHARLPRASDVSQGLSPPQAFFMTTVGEIC